jgi:hypothetical protein
MGLSATSTGKDAILGALFSTTPPDNNSYQAITQSYSSTENQTYYIPRSLEKVTITRPASQIAYGALSGCTMLKEVTIPSTIRGVGEKALFGCNGLEHIYSEWANPPVAYANSTFDGVNKFNCILHVPIGSKAKYASAQAPGWNEFYIDNIQEEAAVTITARPIPLHGGIIDGTLQYNYDATARLTASGNMGYDFKCWMENENVVSVNREYEFTVEGARILYAVFAPRENADENIQITPSPTSASISWTVVEDADSYELIIYADESRTQEIARFQLDADGNVLRASNRELSCNVTDLLSGTAYYYSLTSYDSNRYALTISNGDFNTTTTGIDNPFAVHSVRIYPNPVQAGFYVSGIEGTARLKVLDISGKLILSRKIANRDYVLTGSFPEGIYIVKVSSDKGTTERKIIKRK